MEQEIKQKTNSPLAEKFKVTFPTGEKIIVGRLGLPRTKKRMKEMLKEGYTFEEASQ